MANQCTLITVDRETGATIRTPWPGSERDQMARGMDELKRQRERRPRDSGQSTIPDWLLRPGPSP